MSVLIGIVIPKDIQDELTAFCRKYNYNLVDPHITMILPECLEMKRGLDRKMQSFCLSQPPFNTIIGGPILEHNEKLYLTVLPGMLNTTRERLAEKLKVSPGNELYRPHVSLIVKRDGKKYPFKEILEDARKTFIKAKSIAVDAIATYTRDDPSEPYRLEKAYPFTGR